jgi:hypothetical protein
MCLKIDNRKHIRYSATLKISRRSSVTHEYDNAQIWIRARDGERGMGSIGGSTCAVRDIKLIHTLHAHVLTTIAVPSSTSPTERFIRT